MNIKLASELDGNIRKDMSEIFAKGFSQWLKFFSKDTRQLSAAFEHSFILNHFYLAIMDDKIVGMAACTDGKTPCMKLQLKELCRHLGMIKGSMAYLVLKKEFENHTYPFDMETQQGSIEFVAADEKYRGRGVASSIITHICSITSYNEYVLEVADTNIPAVKLYEKLKFQEFMRIPLSAKVSKESGINHLVYMKHIK